MPKLNTAQFSALIYLIVVVCLGYGYAVGKYQIFPHALLQEVEDFFTFEAETGTLTAAEKLEHDLDLVPRQWIYKYPEVAAVDTAPAVLADKRDRREQPKIAMAPNHREGYRAIFGGMDFEGSFWGGALVNADMEIEHTWKLSTEDLPLDGEAGHNMVLYGANVLPDGSVIYILHRLKESGAMFKVDACGNLVWKADGVFHHSISLSEDQSYFWTYRGHMFAFHHELTKVDTATGEVLQSVDMRDVFDNNRYVHIFNLREDTFFHDLDDTEDISHGNDVDELTEAQAAYFPDFAVGDLLLSYRNQNLVFVIDPVSYKVKWWRVGATDRQHDTDWENGFITAFSNNMAGGRRGTSDVVRINPKTMEHDILVDGGEKEFFSIFQARQHLTEFGTRIITSTTQGWVFEVDADNNTIFSFVNAYSDAEQSALAVSEGLRLPADYFDDSFAQRSCQ